VWSCLVNVILAGNVTYRSKRGDFVLDFPGVSIAITDEAFILSSERPLATVSSAVVGGGFQQVHTIINRHVAHNYNCADPVTDLQHFARELELQQPFIGMLTGVPIHGTRTVTLCHEDLTVASIITAGISNAVTSGVSEPVPFVVGTINITVLIDAHLVPGAMVNAVMAATEAKTATLVACGVRSAAGDYATGTSTDALVIACTGRGTSLPYAGPATNVGYLIGRSVRECLSKALEPCGVFVV
jgi:adenosylcobinamide hydrolase